MVTKAAVYGTLSTLGVVGYGLTAWQARRENPKNFDTFNVINYLGLVTLSTLQALYFFCGKEALGPLKQLKDGTIIWAILLIQVIPSSIITCRTPWAKSGYPKASFYAFAASYYSSSAALFLSERYNHL